MADIVDIATDNQQEVKPVIKYNFKAPSKSHCVDCDDPIPEARQRLGGVEGCVDCQEMEDRK